MKVGRRPSTGSTPRPQCARLPHWFSVRLNEDARRPPDASDVSTANHVTVLSLSLRTYRPGAENEARRRRRPSVVAARSVSGDLSPQLNGQQQRWDGGPERACFEDGIPEMAGRGRDLDRAVLPVAAG